jgi:uncharacterized protein
MAPLYALEGRELARALAAGIAVLRAERERLDRINVFPVADGDTGTNLAFTLAGVAATLAADEPHAGRLLAKVADAALDASRGNSGAILAQFLQGLAESLSLRAAVSAAEWAEGLRAGAELAREAVAEPKPGTLLSVLADYAAAVAKEAKAGRTELVALFASGRATAERSLEATREQLAELRDAGVVDAGAAGFVCLARGMAEYLATGIVPSTQASGPADPREFGAPRALEHRYCIECLVRGREIDRRHLREQLAQLCSSVVVAGSKERVRVHVHGDAPERVFALCAGFGAVSLEKADDLRRQQEAAHHAGGRRVAVVTDSAADLPEELIEALDVHVVPVRVHFGEQSYLDKVSLTSEEFQRLLAASELPPKTSQPPPGDFRRLYEFLLSHFAAVVSLNLAARASGTWQAAESAAARVDAQRISVLDTRNASLGQGLIVLHGARCAAAGLSAPEVLAEASALVGTTRTWALLRTLEQAVRGGRIPRWAERVARYLGLHPLVTFRPNGTVGIGALLIGRRDPLAAYARFLRRRIVPGRRYRLAVGHGDVPVAGERLRALLADHPAIAECIGPVALGAALSVHGGAGMLVVALQEYRAVPEGRP